MHFNILSAMMAEGQQKWKEKKMIKTKKRNWLTNLLMKKEYGDSQLVVSIIMIIIALILCFLFKDNILDFMTTAFTSLTGKLNTLLSTI